MSGGALGCFDIGMHLRLPIPADAPVGAGETWTPDLAREFFASNSARRDAFDLTAWHNTALPLGSLGLDDLSTKLGQP